MRLAAGGHSSSGNSGGSSRMIAAMVSAAEPRRKGETPESISYRTTPRLKQIFGDAPGFIIEARSSTNPGFMRYWQTFSEGVAEVIDARVYSGIHFRTADEVGARLGQQVARFVLTHAVRRTKKF